MHNLERKHLPLHPYYGLWIPNPEDSGFRPEYSNAVGRIFWLGLITDHSTRHPRFIRTIMRMRNEYFGGPHTGQRYVDKILAAYAVSVACLVDKVDLGTFKLFFNYWDNDPMNGKPPL